MQIRHKTNLRYTPCRIGSLHQPQIFCISSRNTKSQRQQHKHGIAETRFGKQKRMYTIQFNLYVCSFLDSTKYDITKSRTHTTQPLLIISTQPFSSNDQYVLTQQMVTTE